MELTNKAVVAAVVFEMIPMATFAEAEAIGWEVCRRLGIEADVVREDSD